MSAVTSSPSPAASPRATARSHIFAAPQRPASRSPRRGPASSPPPRSRASLATSRAPDQPTQHYSPPTTSKPQYADAGTQYTPDGLPPTAPQPATSDGSLAGHKRKETSPLPMSSDAQPEGLPGSPPPEPELQKRPEPLGAANTIPQNVDARAAVPTSVHEATNVSDAATKRARLETDTVRIMPAQYETCNPKDLGVLIANMLMELIRLNDTIPLRDGKLTRFHSRAPPGISCHDYLLRLIQHATLSPPILLSMVYYIDRLCALYPAFTISSLTVHRFLITSATVAAKGLSDSFWTNPTYARIGGISTGELATLEMDFLQRVDWRIVPKPETLVDYYVSLIQRSDGFELEHVEREGEPMDEEEPP